MNGIADVETKNTAFLEFAYKLKVMGVTNWDFCLELRDERLQKIDPFARDSEGEYAISTDEISWIKEECRNNPWYFFREILRIPVKYQKDGKFDPVTDCVRYSPNGRTITQTWCFLNGINSWVRDDRQSGKSFGVAAMILWAIKYGKSTGAKLIGRNMTESRLNIAKIRYMENALPSYLKDIATSKADSIDFSNRKIEVAKIPRKLVEIERADLNAPIAWFDDANLIKHLQLLIETHRKEPAVKDAKKNNILYGEIYSSSFDIIMWNNKLEVPDIVQTKDYEEIIRYDAKPWNPYMFDWALEPSRSLGCKRLIDVEFKKTRYALVEIFSY